MAQVNENLMVYIGLLLMFSLYYQLFKNKSLCGYSTQWAELKTVLIALVSTILDKLFYIVTNI